MRVRKLLALTLAIMLVLGSFTFAFGVDTTNWIKVFLDEPATSVIAEYDNGDTEVLTEQGGHWNAPDYKDYVTNQIAAFIVDDYRYAPVELYAGQEANGTVKYDLPTRQEAPMGTITVTKDVTNVDNDSTPFEFSISGVPESVPNNYVDETQATVIDVYYGEYTLEELVPTGYTGVFTEDTVTVDEDNLNANVQFENTKNPILTGILTIEKEVWIDGVEDTDNETVFEFEVDGESVTVSAVEAGQIELPVGTYTISETESGSFTPDFTTTEVSITTDGETVTFINRYETPPGDTGTITFVKEVTGVEDDETLFEVNITGPGDYSNIVYVSETTPVAITGLLEGEYDFTEVVPEGYKGINYSGSANVGGNFDWNNTVNLLNWKLGEIVVEKEIRGEQLNTDFGFRLYKALEGEDELITEGAVSINNPVTISDLEPGDYYINEDPEIVGYLTPKPDELFELKAGETLNRTLVNYQHPKLTIDKSVDDSSVAIGEEVTYTIEVTNLGGFDLPEVEVRDDRFGFITTTAIDSGDTFTHTITTSYPTSGIKDNEATASASGIIIYGEDGIYVDPDEGLDVHVAGEIIYDLMVQDDARVVVNEEPVPDEPSVKIEKVADDYSVYINEDVTYTITVTNDGDVTLYDLLIEDTNLGYSTTLASLAPGAEFSDSLTTSYGSTGDKVNTASVTAYFEIDLDYQSEMSNELYDEDSVTVDVNRRSTPSTNYEMEIVKTALEDEVEVGDVANFRIVVRNTGEGTLTDIRVVDDMTGLDETITLGEGDSETFNVSVVTDEIGTLTNTAEATHSRASFVRDSDLVEVVGVDVPDEPTPEGVPGTYEIEIEKEAVTEDDIFSGDMVEFTIVVTNTGDETVENILVEDNMVDFEAVIDKLDPGESKEFTVMVEAPNIPGPFTNTATATSSETGTVEADDTVFVEEPVPLDVPDTGVAPTELFFGLGALASGFGLAITKKRRR